MIKQMILNNLVLVDSCEVYFNSSFNVFTGETGAGKTAFIEAIALCLGSRADSGLIRKGADRAFVEVAFEIDISSPLRLVLDEMGLAIDTDELLIIRREIAKEGKNRAFINCRSVPLPFLQKIGEELIDLIGQRAYHALLHHESQRGLLDLFGNLQGWVKTFQQAYAEQKELQQRQLELQQFSLHREREEDHWRQQIEEIESVNLKKGEEEEVYEKYQRLANAQEISEKLELMIKGLSDSPSAILPQLARLNKTSETLLNYDRQLNEPTHLLHEAQIALTEALRTFQSYSYSFGTDPNTFKHLEERLNTLARLKRKYGQTFDEIDTYYQKIKKELGRLENLSEEISSLEIAFQEASEKTELAARELTLQRKATALQLQDVLTLQLQQLNMNGAEVTIEILNQTRHNFGDDTIQFWLKANKGETSGLVKEHASGGELSRLLFAIKIALAEKNNTPTLIFDEVDANVGGTTASTMGEKLQELGKYRQVICITHFPQVASKADTHFKVQKIEVQGRTKTVITPLTQSEREQELLRMVGVDTLLSFQKT